MSNERLDRLELVAEASSQTIERLSNTIDVLVTEFIRPATQQAFANFERLERIESALEAIVEQSLVNEQQIASNAEAMNRLQSTTSESLDNLSARVSEQSQQIQILIEENRADRQTIRADRESNERLFSEALAAIVANGSRISVIEQR